MRLSDERLILENHESTTTTITLEIHEYGFNAFEVSDIYGLREFYQFHFGRFFKYYHSCHVRNRIRFSTLLINKLEQFRLFKSFRVTFNSNTTYCRGAHYFFSALIISCLRAYVSNRFFEVIHFHTIRHM